MKSQGILALLLITAGGLIYASTHPPRSTAPMQTGERNTVAPARLAQLTETADVTGQRFGAEALDERIDRLLDNAIHDASARRDGDRFVCKLPAEVGPVPLLEAVDAYLRGLPDSRHDPALLRDLHRAARQGNWLAKVQVLLSRNDYHAPDDTTAFRPITLGEWMRDQRLGALYAAAGNADGAVRPRRAKPAGALSSLDFFAAMHHNYPSQYKVGRELLRSGDALQAALGRRMLDCAARALPMYAQMDGNRTLARQ